MKASRTNPILEEIYKFREEYAARFDYDLDAIVSDLERMEQEDGGYPDSAPEEDKESASSRRRASR
jgi:hypothetical protein